MYKQLTNIFLLFFFIIGSIPDSLGCQNCLGRPVKSFGINLINPPVSSEASGTGQGIIRLDRANPLDQEENASCHFCCLETAANPVGFSLPKPLMFFNTKQIIASDTGDLVFPISQPPENLLSILL
jgi:hypothetical protein